jgi:hypothetical protein
MTITNMKFFGIEDTLEVECDHCSFSQEYETDAWPTLLADMKKDGWKSRKDDKGEWEHTCSSCVELGK